MKALVTGHMGFIGSHLFAALCKNSDYTVLFGLDLKDGDDIRVCQLPEVDVCFHLAGQIYARSLDVIDDASHNIMGTLRILERYGEKVVFATSRATGNPVTPYTISKLACEHYCRLFGARMVSMPNITGAGGHSVFEAFEKAQTLKINGDGSQRRPYTHVDNAVKAFLQAVHAPPGHKRILDGNVYTVLEIAETFFPNKPYEFVEREKYDVDTVS